jgi:hypothetical protein
VHGLGSGEDVGVVDAVEHIAERRHGGEEADFVAGVTVDQGEKGVEEGERLPGSFVHLPVAGDKGFARCHGGSVSHFGWVGWKSRRQ